jgi:FKBP-type peptidyl-prolyl cis-trans isomerase
MMTRILVLIGCVLVIGGIIWVVVALASKSTTTVQASPSPSAAAAASSSPSVGLQSTDEVVGTGATVKEGDTITVKYTGSLADGTVFDSTDKQGGTPATFKLAKGQLIDGWVQGIPGMQVGGKRKLVIPPSLGYGAHANGPIPANSTLTFEIEIVGVK